MVKIGNYKMLIVTFMFVSMSFALAGCWGKTETQQMSLTTALGCDRIIVNGKPIYRLTFLSTKPTQTSGEGMSSSSASGSQSNSNNQVISIDGNTIWDAFRNWDLRSSRKLFLGQLVIVVVGENTAREGLEQIIDFLLRNQDVRERIWLVVCKGSATDFLNAQPEYEPILSTEISRILENTWTRSAKSKGVDLFTFTNALITPGKEAVLPYMDLFVPPEPSSPIKQYSTGNVKSKQAPGKSFKVTGFAVFRGGRMVGLMNEAESRGVLFINNQVKTAALPIAFDSNYQNVSIRLNHSKTKIKPVINEDGIAFNVDIKASGDLIEEEDAVVKITPEDWEKVELLGSQEIKTNCHKAIKVSLALESDIFGFGDRIHKSHPKQWKDMKDTWEQTYPTITVHVKAEMKLKQAGVSSEPIKIQ